MEKCPSCCVMSSKSRELDDDSLLRIFSKVGSARELAILARVCKRWRDLRWSVDYLDFEFIVDTKEELRAKEGIVSNVLCRTSSRAPGCLKHLSVCFSCLEDAEANGHWLLWTTASLTRLEIFGRYLQWGPVLWNSIMRMKTLEELTIDGDVGTEKHVLLPQVLENGLQMPRLWNCTISNVSLPVALLETIFATCPALTVLNVESGYSLERALRVASNSLENFTLWCGECNDFKLIVRAPRLGTFKLITESSWPFSIHFESAQSLRTLSLQSSHKLYNPPENLQELMLTGPCRMQPLSEMLMLTPMITDLHLDEDICVDDEGSIDILASLVNLRNIYLQWDGMSRFRAGERRFEALNVHLWPCSSRALQVSLFKALIEVHKIRSLVVHCLNKMNDRRMVDYRTKTVSRGYEEWRFLFELSSIYPNLIIEFVD